MNMAEYFSDWLGDDPLFTGRFQDQLWSVGYDVHHVSPTS